MKFLIQTYKNEVVHDFSFGLIAAIRYHRWFTGNNRIMPYKLTNKVEYHKDYIPVGSVEFVTTYLKKFYGKDVKPINVPTELFGQWWCGRDIQNITVEKEMLYDQPCFVKSCDQIKAPINGMKNSPVLPPGNYQISGLIDFLSEWRVFVFDKKMVGLQNYSGDFTKMPNIDNVQHMMEQWKSSPRAYTLDVGIVDQNGFPGLTKVVEAHDFFSCGLYGFADYKLLPYMLLSTWKNLTIQNNISRNQNR